MTNTFDLYLDFQWDGNVTEFDISLGNDVVGTIQGANLPDTLFGLSTSIGTSLLTICGNGHPDCCAYDSIVNPCQGPCDITGFTLEVLPCDSATNTFGVVVDFEWIGDYEVFMVFKDGVLLDSLLGANLPDTLVDLTIEGGLAIFSVNAKGREDCVEALEVDLAPCYTIPCDISNLLVIPGGCNSDSTFTMLIDFTYQGFNQDSVDIWASGTYIGAYTVDSLPVQINAFPWNGMDTMSVQICQQGDPECCEMIAFAAPFCGCEIQSITAETLGYCNPDSATFPVVLDVQWRGDVSAFTVYADTVLLGVLGSGYLPDTIFNFPIPVGEFAEVTICGNDDPTCCASLSFLAPVCDNCEISIVSIDTFQCTGPSTFSAWVDFTTDGFDNKLRVWANDVFVGDYQQFHPILVHDIPESTDPIVLRICNTENLNCCTEMEFQGMHCVDDTCKISNITADISAQDTSGLFTVTLDFAFDNVGTAFTISGNGSQYGVYTYNSVPVTLNPFQCDSTTEWEFVILDLQNNGCLNALNIGVVECDTTTNILSGPLEATPLEIYYGRAGAYFVVPDGATEFLIWTYDGRLLGRDQDIQAGELQSLSRYITTSGFYVVQVRSAEKIYVAKVVGFYE
jgi:hypothetical protein